MPNITRKEDLIQEINFIIEEDAVLEVIFYVTLKNGAFLKLDMANNAINSIISDFSKEIKRTIVDADYQIKAYSTADDRKDCYFIYDLNDIPETFEHIKSAGTRNDIPFFTKENSLKEINGLITVIAQGDKMVKLYRPVYGIDSTITKDRHMFFIENDTRFVKLSAEVFNINPNFSVIYIADEFIITDIDKEEKSQKLTEIIVNEAKRLVQDLNRLNLIKDINVISNMIPGNVRLAKKIIKTLNSSRVLRKGITNIEIINFAKSKADKIGKIPIDDATNQFDPKHKTEIERIIKLLSDDILKSELTNYEYVSTVKDLIPPPANAPNP